MKKTWQLLWPLRDKCLTSYERIKKLWSDEALTVNCPATPKSASLAWPSVLSSMLPAFMSRCIFRLSCKYSSPLSVYSSMVEISSSVNCNHKSPLPQSFTLYFTLLAHHRPRIYSINSHGLSITNRINVTWSLFTHSFVPRPHDVRHRAQLHNIPSQSKVGINHFTLYNITLKQILRFSFSYGILYILGNVYFNMIWVMHENVMEPFIQFWSN